MNKIVISDTVCVGAGYLHYELKEQQLLTHTVYTISAKSFGFTVEDSATVKDFCSDPDFAETILYKLAKGRVRPCHLQDVLYDILCDDYTECGRCDGYESTCRASDEIESTV